jgi:two-component system cell cycle response regulator DivK
MFNEYTYIYVEDDALSREVMTMIMRNVLSVKHLTIFEDSTDFIERVKALPVQPDIFLLDIHMKPHTGFELLEMLRSEPQYQACKVIALTASVMNEEVQKLKQSGFDGAIAKPLNVRVFPQLMQRLLNGETIWHIA